MNNDVQLWFANNERNEIKIINEVSKEDGHTYTCPLCNSELSLKQGSINQWHFAHVDKSKCSSESMYHFWIKNKLIQKGDKFKIESDITSEYVCKDILVEESFKLSNGKEYRPDLTIVTDTDEIIYFEMNYSNVKKLEDYLDIWIELGNIVVEVDVKTLINTQNDRLPMFKAKYYNGKCFNVKRTNSTYYNIIGKYKESLIQQGLYKNNEKNIKQLDWFWKDIARYKQGEVNIQYMVDLIDNIIGDEEKQVIKKILNKPTCSKLNGDYIKFKLSKIYNKLLSMLHENNIYNDKYLRLSNNGIDVLDTDDNCYCFHQYDRINEEELIKYFKKAIERFKINEEEERRRTMFELNKKHIENIILSSKIIQDYKNNIEQEYNDYKIEYNVSDRDYIADNIAKLEIILTYKTNVFVIRNEIELCINDSNNEENIYLNTKNQLETYFKNLNRITEHNLNKFSCICESLQKESIISKNTIKIEGKLWLEDTYKISLYSNGRNSMLRIYESFYLSNKGILSECRNGKIILSSLDEKDIKSHIIKYVKDRVELVFGKIIK